MAIALFAVAVFEGARARVRFPGIIGKTGRIDEAEIASLVPRKRFGDLRLVLFGETVVRVDEFVVIKGGLRLLAHIQIIDGKSFVNVGEILPRAVVHKAEPTVHGGRIQLHVLVDVREQSVDLPVSAVQGHFLISKAERRKVVSFVVELFRALPQPPATEIDF